MQRHDTPSGVVLLNPEAGAGAARALRPRIEAWLAAQAPGVPLLVPDSADAAQAMLMILAPRTRVVLVGGDGTLHTLLIPALRLGHRIGLVPAGVHNTVASALSLQPDRWQAALAYALHAPSGPVDVGSIETESYADYFMASLVCRPPEHDEPVQGEHSSRVMPSPQTRRDDAASAHWRTWLDSRPLHEGTAHALWVFNAPGAGREARSEGPPPPVAPARTLLTDQRLELLLQRHRTAPGWRGWLDARWRQLRWPRHAPASASALWDSGAKLLVDADSPLSLTADGQPLPPAQRLLVQVLPRALHLVGGHMLASSGGVPPGRRATPALPLSHDGPETLPSAP